MQEGYICRIDGSYYVPWTESFGMFPHEECPGLLPHCIYFSSPWMTSTFDWLHKIRGGWGGVRTYDLKSKRFERVFFCAIANNA